MSLQKTPTVSGRDFYEELYNVDIDREAQWLRRGALNKVDAIERLLQQNLVVPRNVVELGCGTGAVIAEVRNRGIGQVHAAVDYSAKAIDYLARRYPAIHALRADIANPDFKLDMEFDVAILSHVLEHLEQPLNFLRAVRERLKFKYFLIEVPLEDLFLMRLRNLLRDRTRNDAGHVQFFHVNSFRRLINEAELDILDCWQYAPALELETLRFLAQNDQWSSAKLLSKTLTAHYAARVLNPLLKRQYYAHYAVLCVKR